MLPLFLTLLCLSKKQSAGQPASRVWSSPAVVTASALPVKAESPSSALLGRGGGELLMGIQHLQRPSRGWLPQCGCKSSFHKPFQVMSFKARFQNYSIRRLLGPQTSVNLDISSPERYVAFHIIDMCIFLPLLALSSQFGDGAGLCQGRQGLTLIPGTSNLA